MRTFEIMTPDEAVRFAERVEQLEFVDGSLSARGRARGVKRNEQANLGAPTTALVDEVVTMLGEHPSFCDAAFPRRFARVGFNRYRAGDHYGLHVDAALMGMVGSARRTDLSFTLFLSDPDDYDGGELRFVAGLESSAVKLPAGHLVLYPTGLSHEVAEVTRGARYAAIGWIESWIADPVLRELATKARTLESLIQHAELGGMVRMIANELAQDIVRYGSR